MKTNPHQRWPDKNKQSHGISSKELSQQMVQPKPFEKPKPKTYDEGFNQHKEIDPSKYQKECSDCGKDLQEGPFTPRKDYPDKRSHCLKCSLHYTESGKLRSKYRKIHGR